MCRRFDRTNPGDYVAAVWDTHVTVTFRNPQHHVSRTALQRSALRYVIPFTTMFDDLDTMYAIAGKPLLIGEFSYRAADAGLPNTLPPFFPTLATQADRAQATRTYFDRVLARPYLLGAHWFQYMDQPAEGRFDGENQNFGLLKITDEPWPEVTDIFRNVSNQSIARRFGGGGAR